MESIRKRTFSSPLLGEHYERIDHPSGLRILVFPKKRSGTYALLSTKFGSIDDRFRTPEGKIERIPDGVAHFLEHKLFENPDGSDAFAKFSALGADANAYTGSEHTSYLFECTDRFEESLTELLSFVTTPAFPEKSVRRERGIIAEEIRMYRDDPWERGYQNLLCALYQNHPVKNEICGSVESIARITPTLLDDCYRRFYGLPNMILSVCGNVTAQEVLRVVDRVLPSAAPDFVLPERVAVDEPPCVAMPYIEEERLISKPIFHIGIKDAGVPADGVSRLRRAIAMDFLEEILFSHSGAFYGGLLEEGKIAPSFGGSYSSSAGYGFHCISGESDYPEEIFSRLREYLCETAKRGIDRADFERCRRVLYAEEVRGYDSIDEIASRMLDAEFDGLDLFAPLSVYGELTPDDLSPLLDEMCIGDRIALSVILPQKSENTARKEERV